jgi:hypothetical protein
MDTNIILVNAFIAISATALAFLAHYGKKKGMFSNKQEESFLGWAQNFFIVVAVLWWSGLAIWWLTS